MMTTMMTRGDRVQRDHFAPVAGFDRPLTSGDPEFLARAERAMADEAATAVKRVAGRGNWSS
jgi:hypothetical protein